MKRVLPNTWHRLKSGTRFGAGVTASFVTAVGTVLGIINTAGVTIPGWVILVSALACLPVGSVSAYVRGKMKMLPDTFIDDLGCDVPYSADFATRDNLKIACDMTKPYYGKEYVSCDVAEQWRIINPKAFVQILNKEGILCACFGVLALKPNFLDAFVNGQVLDTDIHPEQICKYTESKRCTHLYISGVIVRDSSKYIGSKRAAVMMWAMLRYVRQIYGVKQKRDLYALAVTKESERVLQHLKFTIVSPAKQRVDGLDLYKYELSKESWERLLTTIGDLSPMCKCHFAAK